MAVPDNKLHLLQVIQTLKTLLRQGYLQIQGLES
jgi:hypothetical protein